jgi:hypothetical protein
VKLDMVDSGDVVASFWCLNTRSGGCVKSEFNINGNFWNAGKK